MFATLASDEAANLDTQHALNSTGKMALMPQP